ncbi:hypothetical protein [Streptomyces clavuligerus]|uniref:hypothetical protein n=1 Tax=Streptomyces clavuligerus TaxID=1901 RepID=UPI00017FF688|nr:hypothetical protein [Streptomyces clavuligerus]EDY49255.1 hypothetical protein SSCG_02283 [Streptomyces clavuligerus]WDN56161.1 hypothetical protein LL058_30350 [Streptomyces clavuligerus]
MPISSAASSTNRWLRRSVVAATVLGISVTAVGCTKDAEKKESASPSPAVSKSADPQAEAKKTVEQTYRSYWDAQAKAFEKVDVRNTGLEKYGFDQAYSKVLADVANMKIKGSAMRGAPQIKPDVTAVSLGESPKKATITDCVDVSNWTLVDAKTDKELQLPKNRLTRFVVSASARTVGDEWKIVEVTRQDRAC